MQWFLLLFFFSVFPAQAQMVNFERHNFAFEYGHAYHSLEGRQSSNQSKGRLTSPQYPFWHASYAFRFSTNFALRLFGGIQFVRFDEPKTGTTISENQVLNQYGVEIIQKTGPYSKIGWFLVQQDHPLYFTHSPSLYKVVERSFLQSGLHWSLGQRRRIGLIWGAGLKGNFIFPTEGGNLATEAGIGGEAYARLGWIGPLGTTYQIKGLYQVATAPNAEITFTHEILAYALQVNLTF